MNLKKMLWCIQSAAAKAANTSKMNDALQSFVQLTEIRNTMARHLETLPRYAEPVVQIHVDDQIIAEWERAQDTITRLKQTRYDNAKNDRDLNFRKHMVDLNKQAKTDWYDVVLVEEALTNANTKHEMSKIEHDTLHANADVKKETETAVQRYHAYRNKLVAFLREHNYFTWNHAIHQESHSMQVNDLMTRGKYARYLKNMFCKMCDLAFRLVNHRIQTTEYNQLVQNRKQVEKVWTGNYFASNYELKDNREIAFVQKELERHVSQLHTLYVHIANTRGILGEILADTAIRKYRTELFTRFSNNIVKYQLQRLQRKPLLPDSWGAWFRSFFVTKDVNGNYRFVNSTYFRYMAFWFDQNKLINQNSILTVQALNASNDSNSTLCDDLVDFLFLVERPRHQHTLVPTTAAEVFPEPSCPPLSTTTPAIVIK